VGGWVGSPLRGERKDLIQGGCGGESSIGVVINDVEKERTKKREECFSWLSGLFLIRRDKE